jgi:hypothetical protein
MAVYRCGLTIATSGTRPQNLRAANGGSRVLIEIAVAALGLFVWGRTIGFDAILAQQTTTWLFLGLGMIAIGFGRFLACLVRAPHQLALDDHAEFVRRHDADAGNFDRQLAAVLDSMRNVVAERDKAIAERDALRKPSRIPLTVAHGRIEFHRFIKQGRADEIKQNASGCRAWADEVLAYVQAALIDEHGDALANVIRHVRSQTYAPAIAEAHALSQQCTNYLEQWQSRITTDSLRPGYMVPAAA